MEINEYKYLGVLKNKEISINCLIDNNIIEKSDNKSFFKIFKIFNLKENNSLYKLSNKLENDLIDYIDNYTKKKYFKKKLSKFKKKYIQEEKKNLNKLIRKREKFIYEFNQEDYDSFVNFDVNKSIPYKIKLILETEQNIIFQYLTLSQKDFENDLKVKFTPEFKLSIINYLKYDLLLLFKVRILSEIINEILIKDSQVKRSTEKLIFSSEGIEVFNKIINLHVGEKNRAFYSYLYYYLKNKNLLIESKNDNKKYRNYILKYFGLESFSKIINNTESPESYTMHIYFDNLTE